MREIKFRAWDETNKIMYDDEIAFISNFDKVYSFFEIITKEQFQTCADGCCTDFKYEKIVVEKGFLMQFTGLLDRNGKEIYEGDIVICYFAQNEDGTIPRTVPFVVDNMLDFYHNDLLEESSHTYEILGNVYQNPELLKEGD